MMYKEYTVPEKFDPNSVLELVQAGKDICSNTRLGCLNVPNCAQCLFGSTGPFGPGKKRSEICKDYVKTKDFLARLL